VSALRSSLRSCAWLALAAVLSSVGLPAYDRHPAGAADDAACQPANLDESRTPALGAAGAGAQPPQHCVFCHWLRAVAGAQTPEQPAIALPLTVELPFGLGASPARRPSLAPRPSRAPPLDGSV
jgi:hypothetical protein